MAHTTTQMDGTRMSFIAFCLKYATADVCLKHIDRVRWADGAYYPACGGAERIYHYSDGSDESGGSQTALTFHPSAAV